MTTTMTEAGTETESFKRLPELFYSDKIYQIGAADPLIAKQRDRKGAESISPDAPCAHVSLCKVSSLH